MSAGKRQHITWKRAGNQNATKAPHTLEAYQKHPSLRPQSGAAMAAEATTHPSDWIANGGAAMAAEATTHPKDRKKWCCDGCRSDNTPKRLDRKRWCCDGCRSDNHTQVIGKGGVAMAAEATTPQRLGRKGGAAMAAEATTHTRTTRPQPRNPLFPLFFGVIFPSARGRASHERLPKSSAAKKTFGANFCED